MEGNDLGPFGDSVCESWTFEPSSCPPLPQCRMYTSCSTCAQAGGCSWCGSLDKCMPHAETNLYPCEGKITALPCPSPFADSTRVLGNLIVEGDMERGGGNIHISGPCNRVDCRKGGFQSLVLEGGRFDVQSGGSVSISAADTNNPNAQASEIFLRSGDGTNTVGGSGGDFLVFAGDGAGG